MRRLPITLPLAWLIALAVPAGLFVTLYMVRLTLPRQRLENIERDNQGLRAQIAALSGFAAGTGDGAGAGLLKEEADQLEHRLPDGRRDAELVDDVDHALTEVKLTDLSVHAEDMTFDTALQRGAGHVPMAEWLVSTGGPGPAVRSHNVDVRFSSSYRDIVDVMDRVSRLPQYTSVESLEIDHLMPRPHAILRLRAYYR